MPRRMSVSTRDRILAKLEENPDALGPQLGLISMKYRIPVESYAQWLSVSPEACRRWFTGTKPGEDNEKNIRRLLRILRAALLAHEFPLRGPHGARMKTMDEVIRRHVATR